MHSRSMSRRAASYSEAEVSIGDNFKPIRIGVEEFKRKATECLKRHGEIDLSRRGRLKKTWLLLKQGVIKGRAALNLRRDHYKEFREFEAELNGGACAA